MGAGQSTWFWPEDWPTGLMFWSTNGMRGSKGSLYEGGIRLPLIFYYPRKIKPGTASDEIVANMDVYPTLCSLCGIHVPSTTKLDGIDISRLLTGKAKKSPHDYIYWKIRDQGAVRHGDWKLYFDKKGIELYNIREDINETNDLSSTYPEMTGELKSLWDKWYAQYEYVFTPLNAQ